MYPKAEFIPKRKYNAFFDGHKLIQSCVAFMIVFCKRLKKYACTSRFAFLFVFACISSINYCYYDCVITNFPCISELHSASLGEHNFHLHCLIESRGVSRFYHNPSQPSSNQCWGIWQGF